jgi:hypothetical protein
MLADYMDALEKENDELKLFHARPRGSFGVKPYPPPSPSFTVSSNGNSYNSRPSQEDKMR